VNELSTSVCYPIAAAPGFSHLFEDFCAGLLGAYLPVDDARGPRPELPAHWPELIRLVAAQNSSPAAANSLAALEKGAGAVLTGQQVGLFGGPLYSPLKAATAVARARAATDAGHPHAAIFWLAGEDHDFAEIHEVAFPDGRRMEKLAYEHAPDEPRPAGGVVLDDSIVPLAGRAAELLGPSEATDVLLRAYQPGHTFARAFAEFYAVLFARQGLLTVDASGRAFHRLGAPVLRAAIERADEFHAALIERSEALVRAGYHAQVAVTPQPTLLFLIDAATGARQALRRIAASAQEPQGLWKAGGRRISTAELLGVLAAEPERISPAALLRPIFQDFLFATSAIVGGPAEIAYFAQSAVLYERILGRQTPPVARFSATLVEPSIANLLGRHGLTPDRIFAHKSAASLAQSLAARNLPAEARERLEATGNALESELGELVAWMQTQNLGLGRSAGTAASKMRYQMNRLRRLAANFELQREATLTHHAEALFTALYPGGVLQERVHGAAYYFARYGLDLAGILCDQAASLRPGHTAIWL
jgi:bacillithiol synthase